MLYNRKELRQAPQHMCEEGRWLRLHVPVTQAQGVRSVLEMGGFRGLALQSA